MKRSLHTAILLSLSLLMPLAVSGQTGDNPTGPTGVYNGNVTTAGSWDPLTGNQMQDLHADEQTRR